MCRQRKHFENIAWQNYGKHSILLGQTEVEHASPSPKRDSPEFLFVNNMACIDARHNQAIMRWEVITSCLLLNFCKFLQTAAAYLLKKSYHGLVRNRIEYHFFCRNCFKGLNVLL